MGLWYLSPTKDQFFRDGLKSASSEELKNVKAQLTGLYESGFKVNDRVKAVNKELIERTNVRTGSYAR